VQFGTPAIEGVMLHTWRSLHYLDHAEGGGLDYHEQARGRLIGPFRL
jgi:hypothetical protein